MLSACPPAVRFKFRRQFPVAGYIVDFYCMKAALIVEADGGQHSLPEEAEDRIRTASLQKLGIRVLRFGTAMCSRT